MSPSLDTAQQLHLRSLLEVGLPLHSQPFAVLGERIGATQQQVLEQVQDWQAQGLFRRFGLVLKHRALGFRANAMLVLETDDYPTKGQSSTRVFWKGTQCALLGMPLLASMRLDEYFDSEERVVSDDAG